MHCLELTCNLNNWKFFIVTNAPDLFAKMKQIFSEFRQKELLGDMEQNNQEGNLVSVLHSNHNYEIYFLGHFYVADTEEDALFYVYETMDLYTKNTYTQYTAWHGGVINIRGVGVGILAESHMGKSTLLAELSGLGFECLADDYIFYDEKYNRVIEFPIPFRLRNLELLSKDISDKILLEGYNPLSKEYEYLLKNTTNCPYSSLELFVALNRNEEFNGTYQKLTEFEAYKELIMNGKFISKTSINQVNKISFSISKTIAFYQIYYSTLNQAINLLLDFIQREKLNG